jgi:site-specific recombinase XerC
MKAKYQHLLKDDDVRRWFENLRAKSELTATVYLRGLGFYCALNRTTPREILKAGKSKAFRDGFTDFVRRLEREGKAGSYIARFKKVLHSWLAYNGVTVRLKVNIVGEYDTPTIADERIPSKEELDKIIRMATPRGRVSISFMAFSGLRPESLGSYTGNDGLKLSDLPEAEIGDSEVEFTKMPTMLMVRKSLSKTRNQYFSFIPEQGITYIRDYLTERVKRGERLARDSPLLGFDARGLRKNMFLRTTLVTRDIKEAILKAGFSWRPYVLRAYFDTSMVIAESKGKISHPYLQFMMGHKGDIEARYSTNKGRLPPEMIEDMREAYKRCQDHLQTIRYEAGEDQIKQAFKKQLLAVAGFNEEEVAKYDMANMTDEELYNLVRQRLLGVMANNGNRQRVIPLGEVERYLGEGWEYVTALPNERAIVKMPF